MQPALKITANNRKLLLLFAVPGILSAILLHYVSSSVVPYTHDSAAYIEAACSIRAGHGFAISTVHVDPVEQDTSPLSLWPPGYPILIYLASLTGMDETVSARLIPGLFFVLLLPAFFFVFRHLFKSPGPAILASIAATFMHSTVLCAAMAWSDIPFLATALFSLACLFQALKSDNRKYVLLAGLLSGYSLLIRNAGYALIFSIVAGLMTALLLRLLSGKELLKMSVLYCAGAATAYVPFIVRNILVFHSIQPYALPPSELSFFANLKRYCWTLSDAFLFPPSHSRIFMLVLAAALAASMIYLLRKGRMLTLIKHDRHRLMCFFTVFMYALSGALLVIASRTKYRWGEEINYRHLIQYNWVLVAYGAILLDRAYACSSVLRRVRPGVYALFVLPAFLSVQFFPILQGSGPGNDYLKIYTQEIQDISKAVALPRDDFVISNRDELIRIFRKRNVRYLDFLETVTPEELAHKVTKHRGLTVVLFRHAIEDYPQWRQVFSGDIPPGYRSVHSSENMVILMHNKTRTGSHRKGRARVSGRSPVSLLLYACCCPGW